MIGGLDTETTGLKVGDHRFVEVALLRYEDDGRLIDSYVQRIDPQRSVDPDAQRVHKISLAMLRGEPAWDAVAPTFNALIASCDLIVAHNSEFDKTFVDYEMNRIGQPKLSPPWFDTMTNGRWATHNGSVPNLGTLCAACGVEYDPDKAHAAEFDVQVMMQCFFFGVKTGFFVPDYLRKE